MSLVIMIPDIILSYFQLCGVRGGGNAAAQALFWQAKKGVSFVLAFESERERNATIMLARRFAFDCNVGVYNIFLFYFVLFFQVFSKHGTLSLIYVHIFLSSF